MPLTVMVVEDEMCIAMLIEDMLTELGHKMVGPAMRLDAALRLAQTAAMDFAILDVNLDGTTSFPVAEALAARGVPFAFATGYDPSVIESRFSNRRVLGKPFDIAALRDALPN